MIKSLRKKHWQVWTALAFLLPAGIIVAWLAIPKQLPQPLLQPVVNTALPEIVRQAEKENYTVLMRSNQQHTALQLEFINKNTLTYPSAVIYIVPKGSMDIKSGTLIGRIETRGTYRFTISPPYQPVNLATYQLILFDFIHQQIIDTINF